jgi:hypothetical protein
MVNSLKIVQFSNYQKPQGDVSHHSKTSEKTASQNDSEKTAEPPGNMGLPAMPDTPPLCDESPGVAGRPIDQDRSVQEARLDDR